MAGPFNPDPTTNGKCEAALNDAAKEAVRKMLQEGDKQAAKPFQVIKQAQEKQDGCSFEVPVVQSALKEANKNAGKNGRG